MTINWERWAAATGIGFVVLFVVGLIVLGDQPGLGESAADKAAFYTDHRGRILTAMVILGVSLIAFLWFASTLAAALRDAGEARMGAVTLAGGAWFTTVLTLIGVLNSGLAFSIAQNADEGVAAALYDLTWACGVVAAFPAAMVVAAVMFATLRSAVFPAWWGWSSGVAAAVLLLGGTNWAREGFWAPDGAWSWITVIVLLAWTLCTSGLLVMQRTPAEAPRTTAIGAH